MRRAILALTAVLMVIFLMDPLAQMRAVDANPFTFGPGLYVRSPDSSQIYVTDTVPIFFFYSMENNLTQISFSYSLDNKANSSLGASMGKSDSVYYYAVSNYLSGLADGDHTFTVYAYSSNGTVNSIINTVITVDLTRAIPFTPLTISPLNQTTYNTQQVPLTYTIAKEVLWSYYSLDANSRPDFISFNGNITLPSLSEGQHKLTLAVATKTGPTNEQPYQTVQTIIFFIDTPAKSQTLSPAVPEFSSWTIPLLLSIMAATAGLLVYRKKRKNTVV